MEIKKYKLANNVVGWAVFAIAAFTYLSTIEPTASLWDCSEFILSAYKLEVGHPPGAPLFMLVGRLFTLFATSPSTVAITVNILSALCSAFTILFLFWSITHLARKLVGKNLKEYNSGDLIAIMGSGIVGALAYTFSDTFWFSAVEGEVYASSSLLTAIVFWIALKWEEQANESYSTRWLLLLAYVTGLSIGVHLLNLLVIPAIVFIYYFKKHEVTKLGVLLTTGISAVIVAFILWGIIPGVPKIGSYFEVMFVNGFNLPINSGLFFFAVLLSAILIFAIYYTKKKKEVLWNTILLAFALCIFGYSTYASIIIRSSAKPSMDQNSPDNIFSLMDFINRTQYGSRPVVFGPYYTAQEASGTNINTYTRVGDKYLKENTIQDVDYHYTTIFPRMYSTDPRHVEIYEMYAKHKKQVRNSKGQMVTIPSFGDNLRYFFDYQIRHMYFRYFMWNFAGRQNDYQGSIGSLSKGNWISGIDFIDEARLGSSDSMPQYLKENKGTNKYYFLPLLLGLIGMVFQYRRNKKDFAIVTMLFFFTGIAIILYLNQPPIEPRERDYTYAGSFYAFAIWIGFGVMGIWSLLKKGIDTKVAAVVALALGLPIPTIMACENWDDHDRSGRYIATDSGYNFLISCDDNSILYSYGDNDTFPLWYNQEVEGVGRSLKVINTMYVHSDWFYNQMKRKTYEAEALKSSGSIESIQGSRRNVVFIKESTKNPISMKDALNFVFDDKNKVATQGGASESYLPSRKLRLNIDKNEVLSKGIVQAKDSAAIVPYIQIELNNHIMKGDLADIDFMANNFPNRSIQHTLGSSSSYKGLENNMMEVGLVSKLVPMDTRICGRVDVEKSYDLIVNKYRYRGVNDPNVYMDESARRSAAFYRSAFFTLAEELEERKDTARLKNLMTKYKEVMPEKEYPLLMSTNPLVSHYAGAGMNDDALRLAKDLVSEYNLEIKYYFDLENTKRVNYLDEIHRAYVGLYNLTERTQNLSKELHTEINTQLESEFMKLVEARIVRGLQQRQMNQK